MRHGGRIYRANLGGPGGEYRPLEVPFCEYAMRGSPGPHLALLVSSCTKWTYAVTVEVPFAGISKAPGVDYRLFEVPFCEYAMRGSSGQNPALLVSSCTKWTSAVTVEIPFTGISEGPG